MHDRPRRYRRLVSAGFIVIQIPAFMVIVFPMTATGAYKASGPSYLKQMFPAHLLITKFFLKL
jgi:hypothetical protein